MNARTQFRGHSWNLHHSPFRYGGGSIIPESLGGIIPL